jgi:hypothetical protein
MWACMAAGLIAFNPSDVAELIDERGVALNLALSVHYVG